jgi:hypothetical protein
MPWEYPHDACETLCRGCHAAEHGRIPPLTGWTFADGDDLGDLSGNCEYCGEPIRYVHLVIHPRWRPLEVGTVCCDKLTSTKEASDLERLIIGTRQRRKRFASSPRWKPDGAGAIVIAQRTAARFHLSVRVVSDAGQFRIDVNGKHGRDRYPSQLEAKVAVFDLFESDKLDSWVKRTFPWLLPV